MPALPLDYDVNRLQWTVCGGHPVRTVARADGRHAKLLASIAKTNVLVFDDWGMSKLSAENRRDLDAAGARNPGAGPGPAAGARRGNDAGKHLVPGQREMVLALKL